MAQAHASYPATALRAVPPGTAWNPAVTKPSCACHKPASMTGDSPVLDRPALRAALSHMQIEEPGTGRRFEEVLAERNDWPLPLAERVADEYCGFLYLAATAGFEVTPSEAVDQAWHLHLEWPHYRDVLCGEILGRPLEHRPGTGEPEEELRYRRQYEETLALYERTFDKTPPSDIWPRPAAFDEEAEEEQWFSRQRLGRRKLVVAATAAMVAGAAMIGVPPPIGLLLACLIAGILLSLILPGLGPSSRKRNAGCGGFGGSFDGDGDGGGSCGAACGGGCGGD